MLRIYFKQHWYGLCDPEVEEALYDMEVMRKFVGIDLCREQVVDEATICKFRHLLESQAMALPIYERVNRYLGEQGHQIKQGTIIDAMILEAPSSTQNRKQSRDPEMHHTRKGHRWNFVFWDESPSWRGP